MEMADLPVAFGPKMADKLSASLSHQKKRVFESAPGILSNFAVMSYIPLLIGKVSYTSHRT